jgi:hypothetical protein
MRLRSTCRQTADGRVRDVVEAVYSGEGFTPGHGYTTFARRYALPEIAVA